MYNALGQKVATLVNENKSPGRYEVIFDATGLSSGLYIYRLSANDYVETRQMLQLEAIGEPDHLDKYFIHKLLH